MVFVNLMLIVHNLQNFFFILFFFILIDSYKILCVIPVLYSKYLLPFYFMYSSLCLLISYS